ncbi:MAG: matrixin family metalloprotease [Bacteriovoracia bacterium]
MRFSRRSSFKAIFCLAVVLLVGSCSKSTEFQKNCALPDEQAGTLSGHWPLLSVPIAFFQGSNFTSAEINAFAAAADTWNQFYTGSKNLTVLDYGSTGSPRISSQPFPGSICTNHILTTTGFTGQVVIYKRSTWNHQAQIVALTSFCTVDSEPLKDLYTAVMELNYDNFFVAGSPQVPDLQSIALHEMGHLLGLNHSCEGTAGNGVPSCNAAGLNSAYFDAVMYPQVSFPNGRDGEIKRTLKSNDQGRANCLY